MKTLLVLVAAISLSVSARGSEPQVRAEGGNWIVTIEGTEHVVSRSQDWWHAIQLAESAHQQVVKNATSQAMIVVQQVQYHQPALMVATAPVAVSRPSTVQFAPQISTAVCKTGT